MPKARLFNKISLDLKKEFEAWQEIEIQIMRKGKRDHEVYWTVKVTDEVIDDVINNFNNRKRGVDLVVDENHEFDHKALGIFRELYREGDALFAKIELTRRGAEALTNGDYFYFSPEIIFWPYPDEETGEEIKNLLIWGAFTNRPFFKKMEPVMANESSSKQQDNPTYLLLFKDKMNELRKLLEQAKDKDTLSFSERCAIMKAFSELEEDEQAEVQEEVEEVVDPQEEDNEDDDDNTPDNDDGDDDNTPDPVQASEQFKEMQNELQRMRAELAFKEISETFKEKYACSRANPTGLFNENTQKKAFTDFTLTLSKTQRQKFFELLDGIDVELPTKFSEQGSNNESGADTKQQRYMEAVQKVADEKGIAFHEATKFVNFNDID